jgi:hypothetical protein
MPAVFRLQQSAASYHLIATFLPFCQCYRTSYIERPFLDAFGINCLLTMAQFLRKNPAPDDYSTAPDDYESGAPEFSTATGKQIQFRVPLWSNRKLVDEEQGHHTPSINANNHSDKPARPKIDRRYSSAKPETLEIVQTRSYPERDQQETMILTDRKLGDQGGDDDCPCEIRWM